MKNAKDVIPWKSTDISIRPYEGFWSFNPSVHFDGQRWICVLRCCDYAMPDGVTVRSKSARSAGQQTKNAMAILDPQTWQAVQIFKMREKDTYPRQPCPHMGYEDMRIFRTDKGGLQGIAAALHLSRRDEKDERVFDPRASEATPQHQPPEQVLLSFDENYDIVAAQPIRGDGWSGTAQKNWVPFDHAAEPRFLYSIDRGTMFDDRGRLHGDAARVKPSITAPITASITAPAVASGGVLDPRAAPLSVAAPVEAPVSGGDGESIDGDGDDKRERNKKSRRPPTIRGGDVRVVRGGRIKLDTILSRPSSRPSSRAARSAVARSGDDSTRMMGSGRMLLPTYTGLRGGTQLVRVAEDAWLGVGHEMKFVSGKKYYWHVWYLVDSRGKMISASEPMKFAANGIEFAAGMAIDGDRVVVSYGVDDMESWLGETSLSAVMDVLVPVHR